MPETEVTREQLLASVHRLQPGDLLLVRVPHDTDLAFLDALVHSLRECLEGTGIRLMVVSDALRIEAWRQEVEQHTCTSACPAPPDPGKEGL